MLDHVRAEQRNSAWIETDGALAEAPDQFQMLHIIGNEFHIDNAGEARVAEWAK